MHAQFARDSAARELAEESLRKLSCAVEQSGDTIFITNSEGIIEYVNPAFEALTGYSREEVIGQTPAILKSGQQAPLMYRELVGEHSFRRSVPQCYGEPQEEWRSVLCGRKHQPNSRRVAVPSLTLSLTVVISPIAYVSKRS